MSWSTSAASLSWARSTGPMSASLGPRSMSSIVGAGLAGDARHGREPLDALGPLTEAADELAVDPVERHEADVERLGGAARERLDRALLATDDREQARGSQERRLQAVGCARERVTHVADLVAPVARDEVEHVELAAQRTDVVTSALKVALGAEHLIQRERDPEERYASDHQQDDPSTRARAPRARLGSGGQAGCVVRRVRRSTVTPVRTAAEPMIVRPRTSEPVMGSPPPTRPRGSPPHRQAA